jgi:hypothetical protein
MNAGAAPQKRRLHSRVPSVVDEVAASLKCGILAHGFLRVVCDGCLENRLVAFSWHPPALSAPLRHGGHSSGLERLEQSRP